MRIAALYDVHAMPWALEAVLAELSSRRVDAVVVGGDILYGPYEEETVELVRGLDALVVRGNADEAADWAWELPLTVEVDGVVYCHATPTSNTVATTAITPEDDVRAGFEGVTGTVVIGHTHHQFDRRVGDLRVVNAGSIGMPYEGEVAAFWTLIEDGEPRFMKTSFDVGHAVERVRASGWEIADEFVAENLLRAPSRDEAVAVLESRRT